MEKLLKSDLREVLNRLSPLVPRFQNASVVVAGGTGFIGSWILSCLSEFSIQNNLKVQIYCLTRNPIDAHLQFKHINNPNFKIYNVLDPEWEKIIYKDNLYIFHAATPTTSNMASWDIVNREIIGLTKKLLGLKTNSSSRPKFIHLSSGGVYGLKARRYKIIKLKTSSEHFESLDFYSRTKLEIEDLVISATNDGQIEGFNPRLFTFYGPRFRVKANYAVASFISQSIQTGIIKINGNIGTTRSYLYPTDLIVNLLNKSIAPQLETIHIGSTRSISMKDLADNVAKIWGSTVAGGVQADAPINHYVPEVLNSTETVSLLDGLQRWKNWLELNPIL